MALSNFATQKVLRLRREVSKFCIVLCYLSTSFVPLSHERTASCSEMDSMRVDSGSNCRIDTTDIPLGTLGCWETNDDRYIAAVAGSSAFDNEFIHTVLACFNIFVARDAPYCRIFLLPGALKCHVQDLREGDGEGGNGHVQIAKSPFHLGTLVTNPSPYFCRYPRMFFSHNL